MSAVTKFFFRSPTVAPTTWSILEWWESRRLAYNVSVGIAGLTSLAAMTLSAALPPHPAHFEIPLVGIVLYAALANACYCFGPALDIVVCRRWGASFAAVGPALFRYGFAFAVGLTLLPVPLAILGWCVRVLGFVH